jgi:ArsR family transcriptional regulator, arsenate/arsenite/antimonite-responsive transcriptional repressor
MASDPHNRVTASLRPTLWRTARALANHVRLRLLEHLLRHPSGLTVSEIAHALRLPVPTASLYLRILNARGLLGAQRRGRWVVYRAIPDRTVPEAARLLEALKKAFLSERRSIADIFHQLTAFTHPRRAIVVQALGKGDLSLFALSARTGIHRDSLLRHVDKLVDRRFVVRRGDTYHLAVPAGSLGRTLLTLAQGSC